MIDIKINTKNAERWLDNIAAKQIPYSPRGGAGKVTVTLPGSSSMAITTNLRGSPTN